MYDRLKPRQEHLDALQGCLRADELLTPQEIAKRTGLTLNAVNGAIAALAQSGQLRIVRQDKSPKTRVGLPV